MKKILTFLTALSLTITPVFAHDRHVHHRHHHNRNNTESAIIGGFIGLLIGSVVLESNSNRHNRRYCADEQVVDDYGRVYWRRICN